MSANSPALRVLENNLPAAHPGAALAAGHVLPPRRVDLEADPELFDLYQPIAPPDPALPHVRANFISTLDGSVSGSDGRSGSINGPADLRVFQILRSQADAVFVGAHTARVEGYADTELPAGLVPPHKNAGAKPSSEPRLITVTRSGDLHPEFLAAHPLVITAERHRAAAALAGTIPRENLLVFGEAEVDFPAALRHLRERGYAEILCEGGPHLFGSLLAENLLAELCLSFSPQLVAGPATRIAVGKLSPTAARLQVLLSDSAGFLMSRWLLQPERP